MRWPTPPRTLSTWPTRPSEHPGRTPRSDDTTRTRPARPTAPACNARAWHPHRRRCLPAPAPRAGVLPSRGRASATRLVGRVAGRGSYEVPGHPERGDGGGVAALVHDRVVPRAEQGQVRRVGRAAVEPGDHVVSVTPAGWARAAGEGAAAVAQAQGQVLLGGDQPGGPAEVEDLALGAEDGRDDARVAGDPADGLGGEQLPGQGRPGTGAVEQVLVAHRHDHRRLGGGRGGPARGGGPAADLHQRVGPALVAGPEVRPVLACWAAARPAGRGSPPAPRSPPGPGAAGTRPSRRRRTAGTGRCRA